MNDVGVPYKVSYTGSSTEVRVSISPGFKGMVVTVDVITLDMDIKTISFKVKVL